MPTKLTEKEKTPKKATKNTSGKARTTGKKVSTAKRTSAKGKNVKTAAKKNSSAAKKQAKKSAVITSPPAEHHEYIRIAAYYRWEQRGGIHGFDVEDWLQAEKKSGC